MARRIDTQGVTNWIRLQNQASKPATPASGFSYFYSKVTGSSQLGLWYEDESGDEYNLGGTNVVARYTSNAGQTITNNAAVAVVNFEDIDFDTHSAVTIGAGWRFTCPDGQEGYYIINAHIQFSTTAGWADTERGLLQLFKNGAVYSTLERKDSYGSASSVIMNLQGTDIVHLNPGEYIDIRAAQNSGGDLTLTTTAGDQYISIAKIKG